ncbi:MAG TPA: phosphoribosylglycinamide formyltransferase [Bacteroidales bacterium]|jgi:phosphoribosylglycinamide formyltransferase-1|nr:phosphoribosylglycinamide formyltransferase [Bacteroidales bacterium]
MIKIAIFASGSGTNAQRITEYFRERSAPIAVDLILSNNPDALVLERARNLGVSCVTFSRHEFYESTRVPELLKEHAIEYVILAGFLWLVPDFLLKAFPGRILNIHPALLPGYGGKRMYGMKVHEAVISNHDKESGITIHLVNERYDEGQILFQAKCSIEETDTPGSLAEKIHVLEYRYFPQVIESYILKGTPYLR